MVIALAAALVILGPKRLPEAGRALGQELKEFKRFINPTHDDDPDDQIETAPRARPDI